MKYIEVISRVTIRNGDKIPLCQNKEHNNYYHPGSHVEFGDLNELGDIKFMLSEMISFINTSVN